MAWFRRRDRRRVPPDRPVPSDPLVPADLPFQQLRSELDVFVDRSLPYAVDVYTPDFLDKLIESRRRQLEADIWIAHARKVEALMRDLVRVQAERARREVINNARQRYLAELEAARDAAVRALLGPDWDPGQQNTVPDQRDSEDGR